MELDWSMVAAGTSVLNLLVVLWNLWYSYQSHKRFLALVSSLTESIRYLMNAVTTNEANLGTIRRELFQHRDIVEALTIRARKGLDPKVASKGPVKTPLTKASLVSQGLPKTETSEEG